MRTVQYAAVACAALMLLARPAVAQQGANIDLQQFRPAMDSKGYITVNASQVLGHLDLSFGLVTSYARRPLSWETGTSLYRVDNLITPQLQAAIGLFGVAELGVGLPLTVTSGVANGAPGAPDGTLGWQGAGDLQLHLKGRILPVWRYPVGLAALVTVTLPTGTADGWTGEGHASVQPSLIVEREFGPGRRWRAAANVGARIRTATATFADNEPLGSTRTGTGQSLTVGTELLYGAGLSYNVAPQRVDLVGEIFGNFGGKQSGQPGARRAPAEAAVGVKVYLAHNSYLLLGGGAGLNPDGYGTPQVRFFGAFIFEPRVGDRDGDGVPDDVDRCPNEPGPRENTGCPDEDRDGDGVVDRLDSCPDQPGPVASNGCPGGDRDGDGVPDALDKCPDVAGTKENDGCPDPRRVIVRRGELTLLDKIYFETNKAIIKPVSFPILNAIAVVLKGNPQILKVEIQGHADARGSHAHNDYLTAERARAVLDYVAKGGVERGRLTSHGYGKRKPLCEEQNEDCWSKNRRVEFVIQQRSDGRQ
jgi:outer membrane protein OmpA-like peptidoglycan-associated protein